MNKRTTNLASFFLAVLLLCASACKHPEDKKPFIEINNYTTVAGYASFGDAASCMNKGICGASAMQPNDANCTAPAIFMYKPNAAPNEILLYILINKTDLKGPMLGNYPDYGIDVFDKADVTISGLFASNLVIKTTYPIRNNQAIGPYPFDIITVTVK